MAARVFSPVFSPRTETCGQMTIDFTPVRIGYVPLTDAAPLLVAERLGCFAAQGLDVTLNRCASWAALRDRMAYGLLDAAQMLSPMPIAAALGLGGVGADLVVGATLGLNGNTITLSESLAAAVAREPDGLARPMPAAALGRALSRRRAEGRKTPVFAVVFPFSSHNYLLRHWLADGGIEPDKDVRLVVVPPPLVTEALAAGRIDGFCAGEPWGSRAVDLRVGRIALATSDIWLDHPEKVLAFSADTARNEDVAARVIAAVMSAARWLDEPANHAAAGRLLQEVALPDVPAPIIARGLGAELVYAPDEIPRTMRGPVFFAGDATRPDPAQGERWLREMRRWRHVPADARNPVAEIWRPALWEAAVGRVRPLPSPVGVGVGVGAE